MTTQYLVGIDLGTTNTVVNFIDTNALVTKPEVFKIPQVTALGEVKELMSLPSFIYLPDDAELSSGTLALPWNQSNDFCLGEFAKNNASKNPSKTISSAKSWLCSGNVDRSQPILPWNRKNSDKQLSPVKATERLLLHIKDAWNDSMGSESEDCLLENQKIVLTVPASFDTVARELTVDAALSAGLEVTLLEEPQAAFYSWLHDNEETWREQVEANDVILVCDIGGGTTDFSLIQATDSEGDLELERIAVGRHILLGGDNMDLALAYTLAAQLRTDQNMNLDEYQINGLTHGCRQAKETLLADANAEPQILTVLGRGSSLIGGTINVELDRSAVEQILLQGFLPKCDLNADTKKSNKSGLRNFGLDYESDPAITKHLAEFISQHCTNGTFPNKILFNGGVSKSDAVITKIIECISDWLPESADEIKVINGIDPDQAVAKGGCWYAAVKQGTGIRIKSGSSHAYYIGVESSMPAIPGFEPPLEGLCAVPFGLEEGTGADIPYSGLGLVVGEITEFRFFSTTLRPDDQLGSIISNVDQTEQIYELPPLVAELPADNDISPGSLIPVRLRCELTETGTVQLWCLSQNDDSKWKLEFELRNSEEVSQI